MHWHNAYYIYVNNKPVKPTVTLDLSGYWVTHNHTFEVVRLTPWVPYIEELFLVWKMMHINAVFCCLPVKFSRAVYLQISSDIVADNFSSALKRFISRKGKSSKFVSYNAKTFKSLKAKIFLKRKNIDWNFIL